MTRPPTPRDWVALLALWRRCYGVSQPEAAALIGVPYKTLEKWEQGTHVPAGRNLERIQCAFFVEKGKS